VNSKPFPHVIHDEFIKPEVYLQLRESFPVCPPGISPTGYSLYWGDEDYQRLLDEHTAWRALFNTFHSQRFIDWAKEQFASLWQPSGCSIDLSRAIYVPYREDRLDKERTALRSVEHAPHELWVRMDIHQGRVGYSRPIHVDHRRRLLSMLIYLCDYAESRMEGGELLLHTSGRQRWYHKPATRIIPRHNLMVAFPCMSRSHHSVPPITSLATLRNYIQVHISSSVDAWDDTENPGKQPEETVGGTFKRRLNSGTHTGAPDSNLPRRRVSTGRSARDQNPLPVSSVSQRLDLESSRAKLLGALEGATDITVIRNPGNMGDHLIHAGIRRLLGEIEYREVSLLQLAGVGGQLAVITGSGGWCEAHQHLPPYLSRIEKRFERVIIFPSSFDTSVKSVRKALSRTRALVFAREFISYEQIRQLCRADIAHDTAFFFDFNPYRRPGRGTLLAFRIDPEAATEGVPHGNRDISVTCESLDEFLRAIARHESVKTDRAHVLIAAALLGKEVHYAPSNYHKLPGLASSALQGYPVFPLSEVRAQSDGGARAPSLGSASAHNEFAKNVDEVDGVWDELEQLRALLAERERTLNDILNSRSFRVVSLYWRLRRRLGV
jgi:hypothetical protein